MVVDRIEGNLAVVEMGGGQFRNVPLDRIEGRVRDGVSLVSLGGGRYKVDDGDTEARRKRIEEKTKGLFI